MHVLNKYFDKIFVLTIESAMDRHQQIRKELDGIEFTLVYGIHKKDINVEEWIQGHRYDELKAIHLERFSKKMTIGEIACAYGHKLIYQKVLDEKLDKVLILEDDTCIYQDRLNYINHIIEELPITWDLVYLDYCKGELNHIGTFLKQIFYSIQHVFGKMKFNFRMIWNYYSKPYSKHLRKAGYHYYTNAYAITHRTAKILIELQEPIVFPSDHLLAWAVTNENIEAYIGIPKVFYQTSRMGDSSTSMVYNNF